MSGENPSSVQPWAFWLFQAAFCGAAAAIVAGAMAERMKFPAYLIYTAVVSVVVYPVVGHWIWNSGGWLAKMGFADFAGSTVSPSRRRVDLVHRDHRAGGHGSAGSLRMDGRG